MLLNPKNVPKVLLYAGLLTVTIAYLLTNDGTGRSFGQELFSFNSLIRFVALAAKFALILYIKHRWFMPKEARS